MRRTFQRANARATEANILTVMHPSQKKVSPCSLRVAAIKSRVNTRVNRLSQSLVVVI